MKTITNSIDFRAVFAPRRARLAAAMQTGAAILPTAPERLRNRDAHYLYRYDSYFYYLSGFPEPESVMVLLAGDTPRSILFCRDKDLEREIWDGFRFGPDAAREVFGFDECYSITELDARMPQLLADQPALYCHLGADADWDARVLGWINAVRAQVRSGVAAPSAVHDLHRWLDDMRVVKDEHELAAMRRAAAADGVNLSVISAFRSLDLQRHLFFDVGAERNQSPQDRARVSAPPGFSEHSTGFAVDLADGGRPDTNLSTSFETTPAFAWLSANAARFHFLLSFPKHNRQGVSYEPWHWRYEGSTEALRLFEPAHRLIGSPP